MHELAAQELRALLVEQHDGRLLVDRQPVAVERREVVGIGRPGPDIDRLQSAACGGGELFGGQAR